MYEDSKSGYTITEVSLRDSSFVQELEQDLKVKKNLHQSEGKQPPFARSTNKIVEHNLGFRMRGDFLGTHTIYRLDDGNTVKFDVVDWRPDVPSISHYHYNDTTGPLGRMMRDEEGATEVIAVTFDFPGRGEVGMPKDIPVNVPKGAGPPQGAGPPTIVNTPPNETFPVGTNHRRIPLDKI